MTSWESRFAERRTKFLSGAQDKLQIIDVQIEQLVIQPNDTETLRQLYRQFHKFVGAGGIYELSAFCQASIDAEEFCLGFLNNDACPSMADIERLRILVASICESLNQAALTHIP